MRKLFTLAHRCFSRILYGIHRSLHELVMLAVTVLIDHGLIWTLGACALALALVGVVAIFFEGGDVA